MGTYTGICLPLRCESKSDADESFRLSEKMLPRDIEHLLPGQGEERGHKGGLSP